MSVPNSAYYGESAANNDNTMNGAQVQPQYPPMPTVSDTKPLLKSFGATGTAIFSGIITSEEYNPDFYWRDGVKIYEQMLRNDAQVNATREMLELPIRRATWSIQPASDDARDQEIAAFVRACLFDEMCYTTTTGRTLHQKWDDILRHILLHLSFGFMCFEVNWRVDDGFVKWARWTPLLPRTVWRWWVGADNELAGIHQWTFKDYSYCYVDIPADKLLLFTRRQEGNNFEGVSVYRSAYKHWWMKQNFERIDAVGIERNAVVPPVIHLPQGFSDSDVTQAQQIAQNMRVNEMMGITLPPGWDLEYPKNQQRYAANTLQSIQYHDIMIARNVLAQFINLGSTETGAYSLDKSQVSTFLASLQAVCEYIEDVINSDAIKRLVDYNYSGVTNYPKLKCSKLTTQNIEALGALLAQLISGNTPLLTADPTLEAWLREQIGIPAAPQDAVQTQNPGAPTTPERPEAGGRENDHTDAESQDVRPTAGGGGRGARKTAGRGAAASGGVDASAAGGDGGGAAAAEAQQVREESRLLRETLDAVYTDVDVVERGMVFFNPNHDAKGKFAPGSGGGKAAKSGGGARGGAKHPEARAPENKSTPHYMRGQTNKERAAEMTRRKGNPIYRRVMDKGEAHVVNPVNGKRFTIRFHSDLKTGLRNHYDVIPHGATKPQKGYKGVLLSRDRLAEWARSLKIDTAKLSEGQVIIALTLRDSMIYIGETEYSLYFAEHADDETVKLFNPNHDARGRFAPGSGGGFGHMGGAGHHGGAGHPSEHDVSGGAHTGGGSGGTGRGGGGAGSGGGKRDVRKEADALLTKYSKPYKADKPSGKHDAELEHELRARAHRGVESFNAYDHMNPYAVHELLGAEKMRATLTKNISQAELRHAVGVVERVTGTRAPNHTSNEHMVNYIMHHVAGEKMPETAARSGGGRKSSGASRATKGEKSETEKTASKRDGAKKPAKDAVHELTSAERAARGLKPEVDPRSLEHDARGEPKLTPVRSGVKAPRSATGHVDLVGVHARFLAQVYGEHQLAAALSRYSAGRLKEETEQLGIKPGRSKEETISRITSHVTEGRYNGRFGSAKSSAESAHSARVAKLEKQIADHEAKLAALRAKHAELTKQGGNGSTKASESELATLEREIAETGMALSDLYAEAENV